VNLTSRGPVLYAVPNLPWLPLPSFHRMIVQKPDPFGGNWTLILNLGLAQAHEMWSGLGRGSGHSSVSSAITRVSSEALQCPVWQC
jgi:hypothetical protein